MNSKTMKNTVSGILDKLKERFGLKEKEEWNSLLNDLQGFKWESDESSEKVMDKLEEIKVRFESIDGENSSEGYKVKFEKLLLKLLIKY